MQGRWLAFFAVVWAGSGAAATSPERQRIPTVYEAGHFYAVPQMPDGQRLRLVVDTGGAGGRGLYVVGPKAVSRLGLSTHPCLLGATPIPTIDPPDFIAGQTLPVWTGTPCHAAALISKSIEDEVDGEDGVLGAGYLPGHIWTFDYPQHQLWLESPRWRPGTAMHRAALAFPRNAQGKPQTGMARIALTVDGVALPMLLDTGATAKPSQAATAITHVATVHDTSVTSYITTGMLDRWHRQHPAWPVIEHGDVEMGKFPARVIEVPQVTIAGWVVGPVWFTERPDAAFHDYMSSYTDRQVEGSVGGNVFAAFAMTLDYPAGTAWFACRQGCRAVAHGSIP